jgi:hypothetical protein
MLISCRNRKNGKEQINILGADFEDARNLEAATS